MPASTRKVSASPCWRRRAAEVAEVQVHRTEGRAGPVEDAGRLPAGPEHVVVLEVAVHVSLLCAALLHTGDERAFRRIQSDIGRVGDVRFNSQLQREAGMTHFEFGVMAALSRQPGRRLQLKDLAVIANGSLSRLSHVISRLERQGWVRRVSGTKRRATYAELTDKGYRKLMKAGPIHFQEVRRLVFDVLTPDEVKDLRRVTSRLNAGLIPETNLGPLARRTRASALRQSS
jgi:DNA-binding MarR family transcriptional regulator